MGKDSIRKPNNASGIYDPVRAWAIKWAAAQHQCTEQYVRAITKNNNLDSELCQAVRKSYFAKYSEIKQTLAK